MKCNNCHQEYGDNQQLCPFDGEILKAGFVLKDKYLIQKKIGLGGMGFVYKVLDKKLDRNLAVKILRPNLTSGITNSESRFLREAQILAKLEHQNIVRILDYDIDHQYAFFVMEILHGQGLDEKIKKSKNIPEEEISKILSEICAAINYAHHKGILHRDLKSSNIFLASTENGEQVKVLDFGVAKLLDPEETRLTKENAIVGTFDYMSPEQFSLEELDVRADIYSLGIILYEMLFGSVPFKAENPWQVGMMQLNTHPKLVSDDGLTLSPEVEKIIRKALSKNRDDRHQTALQLAEEFQRAINKNEQQDPPPQPVPRKNEIVENKFDFHNVFSTGPAHVYQGQNTIYQSSDEEKKKSGGNGE